MMTTSSYAVEGLTCGYCMPEVLENVRSLPSVNEVAVDLVTGGQSPLVVTSGTKLRVDAVRVAVEDAGFDVTAGGRKVRRRGDGLAARDGGTHLRRGRMMSSIGGVRS